MVFSFAGITFLSWSIYFICIVMNLWALYNIYIIASLSKEIGKLRKENKRFAENNEKLHAENDKFKGENDRLEKSCKVLREQVDVTKKNGDKMRGELTKFKELSKKMEEFAAENAESFAAVLEKTKKLRAKMLQGTKNQMRNLLQQLAQEFEFRDEGEDFTQKEYEDFKARIPEVLQEALAKVGPEFEKHALEDGKVTNEEINLLIDKLTKEVDFVDSDED